MPRIDTRITLVVIPFPTSRINARTRAGAAPHIPGAPRRTSGAILPLRVGHAARQAQRLLFLRQLETVIRELKDREAARLECAAENDEAKDA